jgi:DNA-binding CsgD family transcriptional regulator
VHEKPSIETARAGPDGMAALADVLSSLEKRRAEPLTSREEECMALLVGGRRARAIAKDLRVEERTVRAHLENVRRKLHCCSSAGAAVVLALRVLLACCQPGHCGGLRSRLREMAGGDGELPATMSADAGAGGRRALAEVLAAMGGRTTGRLSRREEECMALLMTDLGEKQIAGSVDTASASVHTFLRRARRKLRQPTLPSAAVAFALRAAAKGCGRRGCRGLRSRLLGERAHGDSV